MKSTHQAIIALFALTFAAAGCSDATESTEQVEQGSIGEAYWTENAFDEPEFDAWTDRVLAEVAETEESENGLWAGGIVGVYETHQVAAPVSLIMDCDLMRDRVDLEPGTFDTARERALAQLSERVLVFCGGKSPTIHSVEVEESSFYQAQDSNCGEAKQEVYVAQARAMVSCEEAPATQEARPFLVDHGPDDFGPASTNSQGAETDIARPVPFSEIPVVESCETGAASCCSDQGCCLNAGGGQGYCQGRDAQELPELQGPETRF